MRSAILTLLAERPDHGYEIMSELAERSGGVWRPSPGSRAPLRPSSCSRTKASLSSPPSPRAGAACSSPRPRARRRHQRTPARHRGTLSARRADDAIVELRELVMQVLEATRQVGQAGTARQISAAQDVLRSTRKSLYRLLAEDESPETDESA